MLSAKNRLKSQKDFMAVYKYGKSVFADHFFLKYRETDGQDTRVGFSVGLGFSKKANERNRLKRQMRAALAKFMPKIPKGLDLVIGVKKGGREEMDVEKEVFTALKKAHLIN